jgi:hypothetical protein
MTLADVIQIISTALAALAAGAAWVAARATRDSVRQTRNGNLVAAHAARLEGLRKIHTDVSWLTDDKSRWVQRSLEIRGRIVSTGHQLPRCIELCDLMDEKEYDPAKIKAAEEELRVAMNIEIGFLAKLEEEPGNPDIVGATVRTTAKTTPTN